MRFHCRRNFIPRRLVKRRSNVTHGKCFTSIFGLHSCNAPGGADMNARTLKRAIYGSALVVAGLATTFVARAVNPPAVTQQLQSQRDATIALLEDAIARGDDYIGPLPQNYIEDTEDTQADDPFVRALWLRMTNGPASQQS